MLGYRLLPSAEFDALQRQIAALYEKLDAVRVTSAREQAEMMVRHAREVAELAAAVSAAKEAAAARQAIYESLLPRLNVLETENAQYRSRMTGLPAVAPQVVKGSPIMSERMGAGADLFEDVGDAMASELGGKGLLHDGAHVNGDGGREPLPSAAAMMAGFGGN